MELTTYFLQTIYSDNIFDQSKKNIESIYFFFRTYLKDFDPFETKKIQSYESAVQTMSDLGKYLLNILSESGDQKLEFIRLLKVCFVFRCIVKNLYTNIRFFFFFDQFLFI